MKAIRATLPAFALVFATADAAAQAPDTTTARADSARVLPLPGILVTGLWTPLRADRVGFAASVLDAPALARRRPAYAADALRSLPGAFIDEAAGPGGPTIVRLRGGEEVFTQVLVDGVQINENGGFFDFQGLALSNLERIEVARGPQSSVYGSSAVSGVVQFLTRRGAPGPAQAELIVEGGDAAENGGAYRATGNVSGGTQQVRYSAGAGAAYDRGVYELPHDTRTGDASLRFDLVPSDRFNAYATARYVDVEAQLPVRDPGATRVPLDPNARNERARLVASAGGRLAASEWWEHEVRASIYREDFLYEDVRDDVSTEGLGFFVFDATFSLDSERQRATVDYAGTVRFGDLVDATGAALTYGTQWQEERLEDRTAGDFGDGVQTLDRSSVAGFAEVALRPAPRLDILAGVRAESYEELPVAWTPRASVVFAALPGTISLRASAGRAFKAPNLQQQYLSNPFIESNPDLAPETSTSVEAGIDARFADDRVAAGLTVFRQRFDDLIRTVESDVSTGKQINRNLGESRAIGVEWSLALRPAAAWTVGTEGAWVRTEIVDNSGLPADAFPAGSALPFRPSIVGSLFAEATKGAFTLHARVLTVGAQTVLTERFSGRRERLDPYALLGFTAGWAVSPHVGIYARVDNLLDTPYETAFDRHGRPLSAALGLRFGR